MCISNSTCIRVGQFGTHWINCNYLYATHTTPPVLSKWNENNMNNEHHEMKWNKNGILSSRHLNHYWNNIETIEKMERLLQSLIIQRTMQIAPTLNKTDIYRRRTSLYRIFWHKVTQNDLGVSFFIPRKNCPDVYPYQNVFTTGKWTIIYNRIFSLCL